MFSRLLVRAGVVAVALASASLALAQNAAPFSLEGRTIRFLVPQGAGGATDTEARLLAQHMAGYLPGNPTIIVQNVTGADGLRMLEYASQLNPITDLTIMTVPSAAPFRARAGLIGDAFDPLTTNWLGGFVGGTSLCAVSTAANVAAAEDLRGRPLTMATSTAGGVTYATYMIMNRAFGFEIEPIIGYDSIATMALALGRGEIEGLCMPYSAYATTLQPMVDAGRAKLLLYIDANRRDDIGAPYLFDLPVLAGEDDFLRTAIASITFGRPVTALAGAEPAFVGAMRDAFAAAQADPGFIAGARALGVDLNPRTAAEVANAIADLYATPEPLIETLKTFLY